MNALLGTVARRLAIRGPWEIRRDVRMLLLEPSADGASLSKPSLWRAEGLAGAFFEGTGGSEGTGVRATSTFSEGLEAPRDWQKCDQRGR